MYVAQWRARRALVTDNRLARSSFAPREQDTAAAPKHMMTSVSTLSNGKRSRSRSKSRSEGQGRSDSETRDSSGGAVAGEGAPPAPVNSYRARRTMQSSA
mmetsp:Transcript_11257/g.32125  ORF Transcript_11257/g.32125 Transcript_11257/m.32125 type:complete len:100 (+) Transcript_11257:3-302(+)